MSDPKPKTSPYKYALAPIHWMATADGWLDRSSGPDRRELFRLVRAAGFPAISITIPDDTSVASFRTLLAEEGLAAAPVYFSMRALEQGSMEKMLEGARRFAAQQASLGLRDMFIGCGTFRDSLRVKKPAMGAGADPAKLNRYVDIIGKVARTTLAEGVKAALHPHVGTAIETEAETRQVLDSIEATVLSFGPDTGHLAWVGADLVKLFSDYQARISILHIKDIDTDVAGRALATHLSYPETVKAGLWMEPGRGGLELERALAVLGAEFDGWLVGEVDRSNLPPFESAQMTARWLAGLKRPSA